jgi:hypothetical protein
MESCSEPLYLTSAIQKPCCPTFVTGSNVCAPWDGVRLIFRTPLGIWLVTITPSMVFPIVCLGPTVISKRPSELLSRKLILCLTYTGIATRLEKTKSPPHSCTGKMALFPAFTFCCFCPHWQLFLPFLCSTPDLKNTECNNHFFFFLKS